MPPRVEPRVRLEDRIDPEANPPRRPLVAAPVAPEPTPSGLTWYERTALVALAVFWASFPLGMALAAAAAGLGALGASAGLLLGLTLVSLVVADRLGSS